MLCGDWPRVEVYGRSALALYERLELMSGAALTEALLARVSLARKDGESALMWMARARNRNVSDASWLSVFSISEAEALEQAGRVTEALETISRSCNELEHQGPAMYLGLGELIRAKLYESAGRAKAARTAIGRAVDILEGCGIAAHLATAYDVSARLTRNPRHRRQARELTVTRAFR
jgi:tetratricopeptide (TPR) repeat protein